MPTPFFVNSVPNQPIIVARITDAFTFDQLAVLYAEIEAFAAEFEGNYYRIIDVSEMSTVEISNLIPFSGKILAQNPGSASDQRVVKTFYVGLGELGDQLRGLLEQQQSLPFRLVFCDTLKKALNAVYAEMDSGDGSESDL